jgi:hypothetical protein
MRVSEWLRSELGTTESMCSHSDGELQRSSLGFYLCDEPVTPAAKLEQLLPYDANLYAACGMTAMWILGCAPEPSRHSIVLITTHRADHYYLDRYTVRDLGLSRHDCLEFGTHFVVRPHRAIVEICADPRVADSDAVSSTARALSIYASAHADVHATVATRPLSHQNLLRQRLALADAINVIDSLNAPHRIKDAF